MCVLNAALQAIAKYFGSYAALEGGSSDLICKIIGGDKVEDHIVYLEPTGEVSRLHRLLLPLGCWPSHGQWFEPGYVTVTVTPQHHIGRVQGVVPVRLVKWRGHIIGWVTLWQAAGALLA